MKLPRFSFFWRILSAFVLCGMAPLFLLSVVFTGAAERVIEKNNYRRAAESVESVRLITDSFVQTAVRAAESLSVSQAVIGYCTNRRMPASGIPYDAESQSLLVSDIFQETRLYAEDDDFQIFIIPADGRPVLSKKTVPEQYTLAAYGGWGIFHAALNSGGSSVLFGQPHPGSGIQTAAAAIMPVYDTVPVSGGELSGARRSIAGFVIVDILRKGLASRISQIAGIQGALDTLILCDKNACILYSHFAAEQEGTFFDTDGSGQNGDLYGEIPVSKTANSIHIRKSALSGLSIYGVQRETGTVQYARDLRSVALLIALLTGAFSFCAAVVFSRTITHPVASLTKAMRKVESGDLAVRCAEPRAGGSAKDEMTFLIRCFNRMVGRIGRQVDDIVEQQKRLRISEVKALQAQINPHFLYNTLNSIKSTAKLAGAHRVADMVTGLGKILRYEFTPGEDFAPLEKELEMARNYFEIEAYRWENRFSLEEKIDPDVTVYPVPRLVIQPLVENALIHGLEKKAGPGTLFIAAFFASRCSENSKLPPTGSESQDIVIEIHDDGCGISESRLAALQAALSENEGSFAVSEDSGDNVQDSNGIALVNTHRRLKLLYGEDYGLHILSSGENGTTVSVRIPYRKAVFFPDTGMQFGEAGFYDKSAGC